MACYRQCPCTSACLTKKQVCHVVSDTVLPSIETNWNGSKVLRIGIVNDYIPGAVNVDGIKHNLTEKLGHSYDIATTICKALNYECQFFVSSSNVYSRFDNSTGIWHGLLGDLANFTYDTSVPQFTPTILREKYFDFPSYAIRYQMITATRSPSAKEMFSVTSLIKPLRWQIWMALLFCLIGLSLAITCYQLIIMKPQSAFITTVKPSRFGKYFFLVLINVFVFLARKGPKMKGLRSASNAALTFWGFMTLVIMAYYSGGLLSAMLKGKPNPPFTDIRSLSECIASEKCSMIFTPSGDWFLNEVMSAPPGSVYAQLADAFRINPVLRAETAHEAMQKIKAETVKYLVTWPTLKERLVQEMDIDCSFMLLDFDGVELDTFPFRKGDPNKNRFNQLLYKMDNSGIIKKLMADYPMHSTCDEKTGHRGPRAFPLPVLAVIGALFLLAIGCVLAALVLACETITNKLAKRRKFNNTLN